MTGPTVLSVERLLGLAGGATAEEIQDAVAAALAGTGALSVTYDDEQNRIKLRNLWSTSGVPVDMPALGDVYSQAQALPLGDLLHLLDPSHADYSEPFAAVYQILVGSGVMAERRIKRRLAPLHDPDSSTTLYTWAAQADGLPAGSLSAPSVYGGDPGVSVSRALDNLAYGSYTFPGTGAGVGWYLQYALESQAVWQRIDLQISSSNWRPTQVVISAGDSIATLAQVGTFDLAGTVDGNYISLSIGFSTPPAKLLRMMISAVDNPGADGYPIYNAVPWGFLL